MKTNTLENPLLSLCKCTGTLKYIHLNCIKLWINSKLIKTNIQGIQSYYWKLYECEVCKTQYPCKYRYNN